MYLDFFADKSNHSLAFISVCECPQRIYEMNCLCISQKTFMALFSKEFIEIIWMYFMTCYSPKCDCAGLSVLYNILWLLSR